MDWQLPLALMVVLAAVAYLALRTWRSWTGRKAGGCGGCSCARTSAAADAKPTLIPADQLKVRRRDGE